MKVYYVRHGETEANVAGIVSGSESNSMLTEKGRKQAKQAGKNLQDKHIDLIVCSPLQRAIDTATIIAETIGYDPKKIVVHELFTERSTGIFAGRPHTEYEKAVKESDDHEGLERRKDLYARVEAGFAWLKEQGAQNAVIVSHGGTGRGVKAVVHKIHHEEIYTLPGFSNAEIFEFEL